MISMFFRGEIPGFTRPGQHTKSELEAMAQLVR